MASSLTQLFGGPRCVKGGGFMERSRLDWGDNRERVAYCAGQRMTMANPLDRMNPAKMREEALTAERGLQCRNAGLQFRCGAETEYSDLRDLVGYEQIQRKWSRKTR